MTRLPSSRLTAVGLVLVLAGFLLIGTAWWQTALRDTVAFQLPYLVSAGLTGVSLVLLGATALNIDARRRDAMDRHRQLERLTAIVTLVAAELAPGAELPAEATAATGREREVADA